MYAIIATGGKQYKVSEGDVVRVELLDVNEGDKVTFDQVLMISNDGQATVGNPVVASATVEATVKGNGKNKKVIIFKYKSKKHFSKKKGHRQPFTEVVIDKIKA